MRVYRIARVLVSCCVLGVLAWTVVARDAGAQIREERWYGPPVVVAPPVPGGAVLPCDETTLAPVAPIPPPQPGAVSQESGTSNPAAPAPLASGERRETTQMPGGQAGRSTRVIRGGELLGRPVWGANRERLGIVKDFAIDQEGTCPTLFFAVAPEISGWNGEYVIVPFDAFQVSFDQQQQTNFFFLRVTLDNLQRAPHMAIGRWGSLDRQFLAGARQFYRPMERTAARPQTGGVTPGRMPPRDESTFGGTPKTQPAPLPPRSEPSPDRKPAIEPQPDTTRPQLSPPAKSPETAPRKRDSDRSKPESGPAEKR